MANATSARGGAYMGERTSTDVKVTICEGICAAPNDVDASVASALKTTGSSITVAASTSWCSSLGRESGELTCYRGGQALRNSSQRRAMAMLQLSTAKRGHWQCLNYREAVVVTRRKEEEMPQGLGVRPLPHGIVPLNYIALLYRVLEIVVVGGCGGGWIRRCNIAEAYSLLPALLLQLQTVADNLMEGPPTTLLKDSTLSAGDLTPDSNETTSRHNKERNRTVTCHLPNSSPTSSGDGQCL
ncbi:hypothetical protein BDZ97DRAFT_2057849, partial [Flammula alnicola]